MMCDDVWVGVNRESYLIIQQEAPRMLTLLHDSFRLNIDIWGDFMQGCQNYAFDTHIYQAWVSPEKEQRHEHAAVQ